MRGLFVFAAVGSLGVLRAVSAPLDEEPLALIDAGLVSEHVFRGLERAGAAGRVALDGRAGAWRAGFLGIIPLDDDEPAEWRVSGGWGRGLGDNFVVRAEFAWARFSPVPLQGVRDSFEAGLSARWTLPREFAVVVGAYHDFRLDADTSEAALEYSLPLTRLGAYVDLRLVLGWSEGRDWRPRAPGARVADAYGYFGAAAELPYRVGANTSVVLGARFSETWNARDAGVFGGPNGRRNLVGEIGLRFDF